MADPRIYLLLMKLRAGGALVSAEECSAPELALAKAEDRFTIDSDGFEYVWRPPTTVRRRRFSTPR